VLTLSKRVEAIKLHDGGKSSWDVAQIMAAYILYIYAYTCTCTCVYIYFGIKGQLQVQIKLFYCRLNKHWKEYTAFEKKKGS
jgi:hypothetical protein